MAATATATLPIGRLAGAEVDLLAGFCEAGALAALGGDGGVAGALFADFATGLPATGFFTGDGDATGLEDGLRAAGTFFAATAFRTGALATGFLAGAAFLATDAFFAAAFFAGTTFFGAAFFTAGFFTGAAFLATFLVADAFLAAGFLATAFLAAGLTVLLVALAAFFADFFTATSALSFLIPL